MFGFGLALLNQRHTLRLYHDAKSLLADEAVHNGMNAVGEQMDCDLHGWLSTERVGPTRGPATYHHLCACCIGGIRWCGGAGVWGKVRACLLHGAGIAMNLGPELHSLASASVGGVALGGRGGGVSAEGVWGPSCDPFDGRYAGLLAMKQREVSKGLIVVGAAGCVRWVLSDLSSEQRETMLASWLGPNNCAPQRVFPILDNGR